MNPYLMLIAAFIGGAILAVLSYFLARWVLLHHSAMYGAVSLVRGLCGVAYLAALFFLGRSSDYLTHLLIGGALGLTLPAFYLTARLVKLIGRSEQEGGDDRG